MPQTVRKCASKHNFFPAITRKHAKRA